MASRPTTPLSSCLGAFVYRLFVTLVELMIVRGKPRRALEAALLRWSIVLGRGEAVVMKRRPTCPPIDVERSAFAGFRFPTAATWTSL
jgi:hypothetical protein